MGDCPAGNPELLDANHDGTVTAEEKQNARIIIYGIAGGFGSIYLARTLEKNGIPVLLTLQVDASPGAAR